MSKTLIILLVLPALACIALPAVHSNENKETNESLIANITKNDISQEVSTNYVQIVEITPIPTDTPKPTPSPEITRKPQSVTITPTVRPTRTLPVITVTATPKSVIIVWPKEKVIARLKEVFGVNAEKAINIATCESGLNSASNSMDSNGYHSVGLFRINAIPGRPSIDQLLDPETNIQLAYRMSGNGSVWAKAWVNCSRKYGYS